MAKPKIKPRFQRNPPDDSLKCAACGKVINSRWPGRKVQEGAYRHLECP